MERQQEETRWTLLMSKWYGCVHRERLRKRQRQEVESHYKKPEDEFHKIKQEAFKLKKQNHAPPLFASYFLFLSSMKINKSASTNCFSDTTLDAPLLHTHLFHIVYHAGSHRFAALFLSRTHSRFFPPNVCTLISARLWCSHYLTLHIHFLWFQLDGETPEHLCFVMVAVVITCLWIDCLSPHQRS